MYVISIVHVQFVCNIRVRMILIEVAFKVTNYDGPAFKLDWVGWLKKCQKI